jgi:hypothetical protein
MQLVLDKYPINSCEPTPHSLSLLNRLDQLIHPGKSLLYFLAHMNDLKANQITHLNYS